MHPQHENSMCNACVTTPERGPVPPWRVRRGRRGRQSPPGWQHWRGRRWRGRRWGGQPQRGRWRPPSDRQRQRWWRQRRRGGQQRRRRQFERHRWGRQRRRGGQPRRRRQFERQRWGRQRRRRQRWCRSQPRRLVRRGQEWRRSLESPSASPVLQPPWPAPPGPAPRHRGKGQGGRGGRPGWHAGVEDGWVGRVGRGRGPGRPGLRAVARKEKALADGLGSHLGAVLQLPWPALPGPVSRHCRKDQGGRPAVQPHQPHRPQPTYCTPQLRPTLEGQACPCCAAEGCRGASQSGEERGHSRLLAPAAALAPGGHPARASDPARALQAAPAPAAAGPAEHPLGRCHSPAAAAAAAPSPAARPQATAGAPAAAAPAAGAWARPPSPPPAGVPGGQTRALPPRQGPGGPCMGPCLGPRRALVRPGERPMGPGRAGLCWMPPGGATGAGGLAEAATPGTSAAAGPPPAGRWWRWLACWGWGRASGRGSGPACRPAAPCGRWGA
jgi:hypothetical protein